MSNKVYKECVQRLVNTINDIDLRNRDVYMNWLAQTYYYTSNSEKLLRTFAEDAKIEDVKDRWNAHADEESGHENLALSDLKKMGANIEDFPELQITKDLYEKQLPISKKTNGIAPFGWALALEGMAASMNEEYVEAVISQHGKNATRFAKVHAEEDEEHIEKALEMVSKIGDSKEIDENIKLTTDIYCELLLQCYELGHKKTAA